MDTGDGGRQRVGEVLLSRTGIRYFASPEEALQALR
jgi:hypothetical protein